MDIESTRIKLIELIEEINSQSDSHQLQFQQQEKTKKNMAIIGQVGRLYVYPGSSGYDIGLSGIKLESEMSDFMVNLCGSECTGYKQKNQNIGMKNLPYWRTDDFNIVKIVASHYATLSKSHSHTKIFPDNITREHLLQAIDKIDSEGIPNNARSSTYDVDYNNNKYPPKLVVSWANIFANGEELDRSTFSAGKDHPCFKLLEKEGFKIIEKAPLSDMVKMFLEDAKSGNLKTKHYPKIYKNLKVKASFGQGALAKIPWIAFLKDNEKVSKGIYPVFLYYKEFECLILAYGISETNTPTSSWNVSHKIKICDFLNEHYSADPKHYSDSFVCEWFDTSAEIDGNKLQNKMDEILNDYKNINIKASGESEPMTDKATINEALNQILYGPPGTGKTYNTIMKAAQIISKESVSNYKEAQTIFNEHLGSRIQFITFHQNYSYEDFIQGLRPNVEQEGELTFEKKDGVFKRISDRALININNSLEPSLAKLSFDDAFSKFIEPLVEDEHIVVQMKKSSFQITDISARTIYFKKQDGNTDHTLSIQSLNKMYDKGINDVIKGGLAPYYNPLLEELLSLGRIDSSGEEVQQYVIIIDEINRANISRVFGELITLIEPDKRSHGAIPLKCTLPSGDEFIVPSNLHIIGTMNTADKSIALLDIALRRRFIFKAMYPRYKIEDHEVFDVEILKKINNKIIELKGHDFQIGHAYFMDSPTGLIERMNNKVIPLLLEYFMNDAKEVKSILNHAGLEIENNSWPLRINGTSA